MYTLYLSLILLSVFFFAAIGTAIAYYALMNTRLLDNPNERSSHVTPTPRGGGIAVLFAVLSFYLVTDAKGSVMFGALLLAVVSFIDDWKGHLAIEQRMAAQILVSAIVISGVDPIVFTGLTPLFGEGWFMQFIDKILLMLPLLWFTNLYNFMDGIDGITGVETISIGVGLALVCWTVGGLPHMIVIEGLICGAAMLAFLLWNWPPAKLFLGDVGSVPLGFLMGTLLIMLASTGYWEAALILPAYYVSDATLTLLKRLNGKENIWKAHASHYYQQAARKMGHEQVVMHIIALNIILIALAVVSTLNAYMGLISLFAAYVLACILLGLFHSNEHKAKSHVVPS